MSDILLPLPRMTTPRPCRRSEKAAVCKDASFWELNVPGTPSVGFGRFQKAATAEDAMIILKPVWILRFATHLHKLRPLVSSPEALAVAKKVFNGERDQQPERAAEAYAEVMPPEDPDAGMTSEADA